MIVQNYLIKNLDVQEKGCIFAASITTLGMDKNRLSYTTLIIRATIAIVFGALSIYLILTFIYPYHLAHRAQYTLPGAFPTEPGILTLTITCIGLVIGALLRVIRLPWWLAYPISAVTMLVCTCHACDVRGRWFHLPKLSEEPILAIDTEAYRGNWPEVQRLTQGDNNSYFWSYYHNLALAHQGHLADSLMYQQGLDEKALFYPIDEKGNYMSIFAAGEVWWFVQDLTMSEHAAMLGLTFSPNHTGVRPIQRLYQINKASGNERSARKFHRILTEYGVQIPETQRLASHASSNDTLRLAPQYALMLRSTLDRNRENLPALEYLLCLDLVYRDFKGFRADVERYGIPSNSRLYQEAMLIIMSYTPELRDTWHDYVDADTYNEFCRFNEGLNLNKKASQMQDFRHTYWYYCQYKQKK